VSKDELVEAIWNGRIISDAAISSAVSAARKALGNDGLVILPDGTKYVSSVRQGTIGRIPPRGTAQLVASGIPSAASMCYDPTRERLIVPMNSWFALAFVDVGT
jgi:hypothetical protein